MTDTNETLGLTTLIVTAYLAKNEISHLDEIPVIIKTVHHALSTVGGPVQSSDTAHVDLASSQTQTPAVDPQKSVFPDRIICLEDGREFSMLKRHLLTKYGMTPEQYRAKWGLPHTYPMTAPNYSVTRSKLAKSMGLGQKVPPAPIIAAKQAGRGRGRKSLSS